MTAKKPTETPETELDKTLRGILAKPSKPLKSPDK